MARSATKIHRYTMSKGKLLIIFQSGNVWYPNKEEIDNIHCFIDRIENINHETKELNDLMETNSNG